MANYIEKKLLILGAGDSAVQDSEMQTTEIQLVKYAKEMGLYVVVTDNQLDWNFAPAKKIADEGWNISWSDVDLLAEKCKDNNIDGVFAGFSEKKVSCAAELCSNLGLPFYTEGADIKTIFNKTSFKNACIKSGVDVPRRYIETQSINYPIIVKPVDNAGGRGISVCHNSSELQKAIIKAKELSITNSIEIEEYVIGDEVFVYYFVENGIPYLSITSDLLTLNLKNKRYFAGNRYPSKYFNEIEKYHNNNFKRLINNLNIQNGFIGIQCFMREGRMIAHDPTFRVDGSDVHEVLQYETGSNVIKALINYSFTGSMDDSVKSLKVHQGNQNSIHFGMLIFLNPGVIVKCEGILEIKNIQGVYCFRQFRQIGDRVSQESESFFAQIKIHALSKEDLEGKIRKIFDLLIVEDESGIDMVVRPEISDFIS